MKNKKTIIIIIAAILIIAAIVYFVFFRSKKTQPLDYKSEVLADTTVNTQDPARNDNIPLQLGSKGIRVQNIQRAINVLKPSAKLAEDGDFGSKTKEAVESFGAGYYPVNGTKYFELVTKAFS